MSDVSRMLLDAIREAQPDDQRTTAIATVTGVTTSGTLVRFDGESIASTRPYQSVGSYVVGSRVTMLRVGSSWVVAGALLTGMERLSGQSVVTWAAAGKIGTLTVPFGAGVFAAPPTAIQLTPQYADFGVAWSSVTATSFTITAYDNANTRAVGFQITVHWTAFR